MYAVVTVIGVALCGICFLSAQPLIGRLVKTFSPYLVGFACLFLAFCLQNISLMTMCLVYMLNQCAASSRLLKFPSKGCKINCIGVGANYECIND